MHWPIAFKAGVGFPQKPDEFLSLEEVPIIETWTAMEACVEAGLSKHIGVSNFSIKKLEQLLNQAQMQPEVNQIELHPLLAQNKMLEFCNAHNIFLTAYSPLGSKDRPARLIAGDSPTLLENPVLAEIANEHNCTSAQVLITWAIQRGTSVIPKSVNPTRIKQNFDAHTIKLSEETMQQIASLDQHYRFINGQFWEAAGGPYTVANLWDETN